MKKSHWGDKHAAGPEKGSDLVHVEDLMVQRVKVLTRHQNVGQARQLMADLGIHCLPVADKDEKLVGILTSTDLIDSVSDETLVGKVMIRDVRTVARYAAPEVAARIMRKNHIHHLVVTHEQRIVGVLSSFDLLRLIEGKRFTEKNRPSAPKKKTWEKRTSGGKGKSEPK